MAITRQTIVDALGAIAPLHRAESWDNVGLLVSPVKQRRFTRLLLCIDMTTAVVAEAVTKQAQMVVAYHPPLFNAIKRLDANHPAAMAMAHHIAVYSPHTALDAAPGGVNDWLAHGLGEGDRAPLAPVTDRAGVDICKVVVFSPAEHADRLRQALADAGAGVIGHYTQCSFNLEGVGTFVGDDSTHPTVGKRMQLERVAEQRIEMVCPQNRLSAIARAILTNHPYEEPAWDVYPLLAKPEAHAGQGRLVTLRKPVSLTTLVARVKKHLGLKHVRVAQGSEAGSRPIKTIALCAGAGGSVLAGQAADVHWTGEMRHHDVLAANTRGTSVILCDHTNTERPYLPVLKRRLNELLKGKVDIALSQNDHEPLRIQ